MTFYLKARVYEGRLVLDEPVDLAEGTEVDLVPAHADDDLDEAERARLDAAIIRAEQQFQQGQGIPAAVALEQLRRMHSH